MGWEVRNHIKGESKQGLCGSSVKTVKFIPGTWQQQITCTFLGLQVKTNPIAGWGGLSKKSNVKTSFKTSCSYFKKIRLILPLLTASRFYLDSRHWWRSRSNAPDDDLGVQFWCLFPGIVLWAGYCHWTPGLSSGASLPHRHQWRE